ncbi:MAG: PaaI family thioesterase [Frankiaceae bacterium]|nr:PaaI family thioesterase [Frankiaceae bacterium]
MTEEPGERIDYQTPPLDGIGPELASSVRRLMDASVLTLAKESELREVIEALDKISEQLEGPNGSRLRAGTPWPPLEAMGKGDRPHNPVAGPANPLSPPLVVELCDDGSITSEITMRPIHEGPPGGVHGGFVAALLDQLLGTANIVYGVGAMTGGLNIRYRRPTPIGVPLKLTARTDRIEGRKVFATGEITADGVVTAEAEGIFIRPTQDRLAQHREIAATHHQPKAH